MTVTESTQVDQKAKILLIGDLLIDRTFYVDVLKLSPEAPVPVAMLTGDPIDTPGGAGLAAAFSAVKKIPLLFGTYTSINKANWILKEYSVPVIHPPIHSNNVNTIKTRYIDNERHYHLLRVDSDNITSQPFNSLEDEEEWFRQIEDKIKGIGILAILDYRKGLLNEVRSQRLISMARNAKIPIYVDSRAKNLRKFEGINVLKLNSIEYQTACRTYHCQSYAELADKLIIDNIIETKGAEGACYWPSIFNTIKQYTPNLSKHEGSPDVTGCGDVFDVTFCYEWGIKKVGFHEALKIAVETATKFAYEPIGERLKCQN